MLTLPSKQTAVAVLAVALLMMTSTTLTRAEDGSEDDGGNNPKQIIDIEDNSESDPLSENNRGGYFLRGNSLDKDVFVGFQQAPLSDLEPKKRQFLEPGMGESLVEATSGCGYGRATVYDQICGDMELSYFCLALQTAGLDSMLQASTGTEYTVFAPTNDAMQSASIPLDDIDYLQDLLLFHTAERRMLKDELPCTAGDNLVEMTTGRPTRTLCLKGNPTYQKGKANLEGEFPEFTSFNIVGCNGVVHVINRVLLHQPLIGGL